MGVVYNPRIVTSSLVGYWDAGNTRSYSGSGTAWNDLSGNGYNATLSNAPTFSNSNGGIFSFNGSNQYATVAYNAAHAPTSQISFGAWAFASNWQMTNDCRILSKTESGGYYISMNDGTTTASALGAIVYAGGAYRTAKINKASIGAGWHNIFFTFDGRYFKMFMDGQVVNQYDHGSTTTISYSNNNALQIAGEASAGATPSGSLYWPGSISNVMIYNRGLTDSEVDQNFNAVRGRFGV